MFDFSKEALLSMLLSLPAIFYSMSVHEFSHAYVAYRLGDDTARNLGRLTLNPTKHIDVLGFLSMFFIGFGWAKPVPVNSRYFKKPKRDMAFTALAGPIANLLSSFIFAFVYYFAFFCIFRYVHFENITEKQCQVILALLNILQFFVLYNIAFAIFNMLPIPPFDGSRIIDSFLPQKAYVIYHEYEQYIQIIIVAILLFTDILSPLLNTATDFTERIVMYLPQKIFFGEFGL